MQSSENGWSLEVHPVAESNLDTDKTRPETGRTHTSKSKRFLVSAVSTGAGSSNPGFSGGDRIATELIKRWAALGHRFVVVTGRSGALTFARYLKEGPRIHFRQVIRWTFTRQTLATLLFAAVWSFVAGIVSISDISRMNPDIVWSTSDSIADTVVAWLVKVRCKQSRWISSWYLTAPNPFDPSSPYKGTARPRGLTYWLQQRMSRAILTRHSDMVFVTSEPDKEDLISDGYPGDRIVVVMGGVDLSLIESVAAPTNRPNDAVFLGRFHYQKGVLELVEIWKQVVSRKRDAKLLMIGVGPLESKVRSKIAREGLDRHITMKGFLDGAEKISLLKACRVVVHPATYDSGGMAACEAMACGLPGVCFDLPALRTYYPRGMLKAACFDTREFALHVVSLLENQELYERIRQEAIQWGREWDWEKRSPEILGKVTRTLYFKEDTD